MGNPNEHYQQTIRCLYTDPARQRHNSSRVWGLGTLGDVDPVSKVLFKRARGVVEKGPLQGVSRILPRIQPVALRKQRRV